MRLNAKKGIYVFSYEPEAGRLELTGNFRPEINVGQGIYDKKRDICYIVDERKERPGERGGGGRILCFRLQRETGEPEWVNEKDTLATSPCYMSLDCRSGYLLVSHHGAGNVVTRTIKKEDGRPALTTIRWRCFESIWMAASGSCVMCPGMRRKERRGKL